MPSDKRNSITAKAMGLISSLFNIALSQDVLFCQPLQLQCLHCGSTKAYLCSPFLSPLPHRWRFAVAPLCGFMESLVIAEVFNTLSFWNWFESRWLKYSNRAIRSRLFNRAVGSRYFKNSSYSYIRNSAVIRNIFKIYSMLRKEHEGWWPFLLFFFFLAFNSNWAGVFCQKLKPPSKMLDPPLSNLNPGLTVGHGWGNGDKVSCPRKQE